MTVRSLAMNALRFVVAAVAVAVLVLTPLVIERPTGVALEPLGVVIDAGALAVLVAVALSVLRPGAGRGALR